MWLWQMASYFLKGQEISVFSKLSRPALRPTQSPVQWVAAELYPWVKQPGRKVTTPTYSAEVKRGAVVPPSSYASWSSQELLSPSPCHHLFEPFKTVCSRPRPYVTLIHSMFPIRRKSPIRHT